jgi:hypothetical protein
MAPVRVVDAHWQHALEILTGIDLGVCRRCGRRTVNPWHRPRTDRAAPGLPQRARSPRERGTHAAPVRQPTAPGNGQIHLKSVPEGTSALPCTSHPRTAHCRADSNDTAGVTATADIDGCRSRAPCRIPIGPPALPRTGSLQAPSSPLRRSVATPPRHEWLRRLLIQAPSSPLRRSVATLPRHEWLRRLLIIDSRPLKGTRNRDEMVSHLALVRPICKNSMRTARSMRRASPDHLRAWPRLLPCPQML